MRIPSPFAALLAALSIVASPACFAQKEFNIWCFGDRLGIDFNGPAPRVISSAINTLEGSASFCDPTTGALLFYTDGMVVFNRNHDIMQNGGGLLGGLNSTQAALIVPMPGDRSRYYIFTSDAGEYDDNPPNEGIHYSVVDIRGDNGLGSVTVKNVPLLRPASEKLIAVRHADGCAYWIVAHGWKEDKFYAWPVTNRGIASDPVISSAGIVHDDPPGTGTGGATMGAMKISPDGGKLAVATYTMRSVELFDFDDRTGAVSNPIPLPSTGLPYGLSFSPDNSKLYVSCEDSSLFQFDLSNPDPAAIIASQYVVSDSVDTTIYDSFEALQLAPDGTIYHARSGNRWLGAIRNPNARGAACDYTPQGLDLGKPSRIGLPNLIEGYFVSENLICGAPFADFIPGDTLLCLGECVSFTDMSTNNPVSWSWTFAGATIATSSERHPASVCFTTPGTHRVTLTVANALGSSSVTRWFEVVERGDLRAHIDRSYVAESGERLTIPLHLDAPVDDSRLIDLNIVLRYNPTVLRLDTVALEGKLLAGWRIESLERDRASGLCTLRLLAPDSLRHLAGTGPLLDLLFSTYVGASDTSAIAFEIGSGGRRCVSALAVPGLVRISECGIRERLISIVEGSFSLDGNHPNPFNPTTVIPFTIGAECHATLEVHDYLGRTVAALASGEFRPGAYSVVWDATAFPSGLYYYRLAAGEWSQIRTMILAK